MKRKIIIDKSVNITTEVFFLAISVLSSFMVDEALLKVLDGRMKLFCAGIAYNFVLRVSHGRLFMQFFIEALTLRDKCCLHD